MKKAILVLCMAAGLVSCAKNNLDPGKDNTQKEGVPMTFDVTVLETKAAKADWADGVKIYVFFNGLETKYLVLERSGSSWTNTSGGDTLLDSDFSGPGTKTLTAVHFPVDVTVAYADSKFSFTSGGKPVYNYYLYETGKAYTVDGESSNQPSLESSYLYHVLQLGPMIAGGEYWNRTLTPFIFWPPRRTDDGMIIEYIDNNGVENAIYNRPKFKKRYNIASEVIQTPNGTEIIKVVMQRSLPPTEAYKDVNMLLPNGKIPAYCILNGTIYIDKKKERLLSFDGELIGFMARMKLEEETTLRPASCHIQIEYTHNNGYTEIEKSKCTVKCENAETTLSLTNIGPKPFSKKDKCIAILGNLPEAVREAGYNPALWENEAVKKAIEESTNDHQPLADKH